MGEWTIFSKNNVGTSGFLYEKQEPQPFSQGKINLKHIKDFGVFFLEENQEEYLWDIGLDKYFLNRTQKAQNIKGRNFDEMYISKLKIFGFPDTVQKTERQP